LLFIAGLPTLQERAAMKPSTLPKVFFALIAATAAIHFSLLYGKLPPTMASHFNASGAATAWQPKELFFSLYWGVLVLVSVISFGIPHIIESTPAQFINLPYKDYWLAPERRADSMAFFTAQFGWFGCALLLFIVFTFELAIHANFRSRPVMDSSTFFYGLIAFLVFALLLPVRLITRFSRPR
jgi:uncharacterized membrane protein